MNSKQKAVSPEMLRLKFSLIFVLSVAILFSVIYYNSVQQIQRAASIISSTAGIPVLGRASSYIDGDEFTVLSSVKERENAGQLEQRLRNAFKEYNEKKLHPFDVNGSIGWVILEDATNECFEKAIQSSDRVLYEEKE